MNILTSGIGEPRARVSEPSAADKFSQSLAEVRRKRCITITALLAVEGEPASEIGLRLASTAEGAEKRDDCMLLPCVLGSCAVILDMEPPSINPINCPNFEDGTVL